MSKLQRCPHHKVPTHIMYESGLTGPLYAATVATDTPAGTGPAYAEGTAARNTARMEAETATKDFMVTKLGVEVEGVLVGGRR